MKTVKVLVVRIYITESSHLLSTVVSYLKKEVKIRGMSVFRAISGFGETGNHSASLIDLSLDLPLAIEFFDDENKVQIALEHLNNLIKPEHIISWEANANL
jgi:PII-like signaling protein